MSVTQYNIYSYIKGQNGFGLPFSNTAYSATLAANTDTTLTVPTGSALGAPEATAVNKYIAVIDYSVNNVWVALNATAAFPAGAAFATTTSELLPLGKYVKAGDVLHFISATGADVSVTFYAIQEG